MRPNCRRVNPRLSRSSMSVLLLSSAATLPDKLQAHLPDAAGFGACHAPECRAGKAAARIVELHVLERIEELGAELHRHTLPQARILLQRGIEVVDPRPVEEARIGVAHGSEHLRRECGLVEVL